MLPLPPGGFPPVHVERGPLVFTPCTRCGVPHARRPGWLHLLGGLVLHKIENSTRLTFPLDGLCMACIFTIINEDEPR